MRINNRKMHAYRKDMLYEVIMTDLYLMGFLDKESVEKLVGHKVSEHLTSPVGNLFEEEEEEEEDNEHVH